MKTPITNDQQELLNKISNYFLLKRRELGLTQLELATRAQIHLKSVQRFEYHQAPTFMSILKMAEALEIKMFDDLDF
jgi:transcriptional regulator with XRE-family HTH domain